MLRKRNRAAMFGFLTWAPVAVLALALAAPCNMAFAQEADGPQLPMGGKELPADFQLKCVGYSEIEVPVDSADGRRKVTATHCGTFYTAGEYWHYYSAYYSGQGLCSTDSVTMSSGDTDLEVYYSTTWNSNTTPPGSAGWLICGSWASGQTTDSCDACYNGHCAWGSGVWRTYAICYAASSTYCLTSNLYTCSYPVDLTTAQAYRDGEAMEVVWEAEGEFEVAGYNLLRRIDEETEWVKVNERLVPADASRTYSFEDNVPAEAMVVYYQVEEVSLEGTAMRIADVTHRDHRASEEVQD